MGPVLVSLTVFPPSELVKKRSGVLLAVNLMVVGPLVWVAVLGAPAGERFRMLFLVSPPTPYSRLSVRPTWNEVVPVFLNWIVEVIREFSLPGGPTMIEAL